jgi:hypothetical protein
MIERTLHQSGQNRKYFLRSKADDRMKTLFLDFDGVLHPTFPVERNRLAIASLSVCRCFVPSFCFISKIR